MTHIQINIQRKCYPAIAGAQENLAIADLNLTLPAHEFICLVGPSGCGKTTLLNIIAGLDTDFQGKISLTQQHLQPKIGYVFQNPRLLPWRTVRENIELALPAPAPEGLVDELLAAMQLTESQAVYPERLSLGMSRRVAIIRAFAINPDLLLMDEPFVSIDPPTARQIRQLLLKLWHARPHGILFVTHDLREAITLADQLIFLSASPMQVIRSIPVTIPRSARDDEQAIETFRHYLIQEFPAIQKLL